MEGASSMLPVYLEISNSNSSESSQAQYLETELSKLLPRVDLQISELDQLCIYKVPLKFRRANPKAYTPRVVSIGPFHKPRDSDVENNNTLKPMEQRKLKYLETFLNRTKKLSMKALFLGLIEKEKKIRSCYAEPIDCSSNDFLMMILVDACFIIEHLLRIYTGLSLTERDHLSEPWLFGDVYHDLTLLENQLPFFVLEDIFNSAQCAGMNVEFPFKDVKDIDENCAGPITNVHSLSILAITFHYFRQFNDHGIQPSQIPSQIDPPKHFTDLLRTFMQPSPISQDTLKSGYLNKHIPSASQLSEVGLKFKVRSSSCLFDLKYDHPKGVLEIPCLIVNNGTETMFRNRLAFEQCHYILSPNVTQYLFILDCLIHTQEDVNILIDKKIIINLLGDANDVAKMFNSLCSHVTLPFISEEYSSICDNLIEFYENPRNKYKAIFYHEYFNTPWKKASTSAAVLLLLLTLIQTFKE
ncbi:UPF0481 protein, partial [Mucuna pruriens]